MDKNVSAPQQAVLMCGGLGTRLRPWSYVIPKPMFPIGDKPILERLLVQLRDDGITEIYLALGYKAELIELLLRDGHHLGVDLHYVHEEEPLGTAGALNLLRDRLRASFLLMNGDILTRLDFTKMYAFHRRNESEITMGIKQYDIPIPYGVVEISNQQVTELREKPVHSMWINAGIYILNPSILDLLPPNGRFDATQLLQAALNKGCRVGSYAIEEYWLDIGRIEDYEHAQRDAEQWLDSENK